MSFNNFTEIKFFSLPQLFSSLAITFVGLVEPHETSESESSTFRIMNSPKKPQAAILSSFKMEVNQINSFRLWRPLIKNVNSPLTVIHLSQEELN